MEPGLKDSGVRLNACHGEFSIGIGASFQRWRFQQRPGAPKAQGGEWRHVPPNAARAVDWIVNASARFARILVAAEILPGPAGAVLQESAAQMAADILDRDGGDAPTVEDSGIFARLKHCVQLLTVHKAKGREFEAVAIIEAHDGRFPHFSIRDVTDEAEYEAQYDETLRVVYVAVTRAKRLLMFLSDTSDRRNRPSPFVAEMAL